MSGRFGRMALDVELEKQERVCPWCRGSGKVAAGFRKVVTCPKCEGTGKIKVEKDTAMDFPVSEAQSAELTWEARFMSKDGRQVKDLIISAPTLEEARRIAKNRVEFGWKLERVRRAS